MLIEEGGLMTMSHRIKTVFLFGLFLVVWLQSAPVFAADLTAQPAIRLAAGRMHSALILQDGSLSLWGDNTYGQLGIEDTDYADAPVRVRLPQKAIDVALGSDHTLVLTEDGTVYAMGRNTFGQLGNGGTKASAKPIKVEGLPPIQSIAAGGWHSLALGTDGSVWGWGDNSAFQLGEPKGEAIIDTSGKTIGYRQLKPVRLVSGGAAAIAAGGHFSLFIHEDGRLFSWGDNSRGQLGDGTTQTRSKPAPVIGLSSVRLVSAGYQHVLAIAGEDEALYVWGDQSQGQLGLSSLPPGDAYQSRPQKLSLSDQDVHIALICAGYAHSIAVVTIEEEPDRQQIYVWGNNQSGQLALQKSTIQLDPEALSGTFNGYTTDTFLPFTAVAAGGFHTLVLSSQGLLAACGRGDRGQLGIGSILNKDQLTLVPIPDLIRPGWADTAALSMTRKDGQITIRWPAAQDNFKVTGYKVRLSDPDGDVFFEDVGLTQELTVEDPEEGKNPMALRALVFAYDEASKDLPESDLSRLAGYLPPENMTDFAPEDYFEEPIESIFLIGAEQHDWRPAPNGRPVPVLVPWDVTSLYGEEILPEKPKTTGLICLWIAAGLLAVLFIRAQVRSSRPCAGKGANWTPGAIP